MSSDRLFFDRRAWKVRLAELGIESGAKFARDSKLSVSTVTQVVAGLIPSAKFRKRMASLVGLEVDDLWKPLPPTAEGDL